MARIIFLIVGVVIITCSDLRAQSREKYADSIRCLRQQSAIFDDDAKLSRLNNSYIATIYDEWARMETDRGFYQYASDLYHEALELYPINENSEFLLKINLCELYLRRGMYSFAKRLLDALTPTVHRQKFVYYSHLASYYLYVDDLDSAKNTLMHLQQTALAKDEKLNVASLLSYLYLQQGDYVSSYDIIDKLLPDAGDERSMYVLLSHKAVLESFLNRFDAAVRDIDTCLQWQKTHLGEHHQDYIINLRKKAEILQRANQLDQANEMYKSYIESEKKYAIEHFIVCSEQQRLDYWKNKKPLISEVFTLEQHDPDFLYDVALFRRQVALVGRNDSMAIRNKFSISRRQIAANLNKNDVAVEFIKYEKEHEYRYAALLLSGSSCGKVEFIPLWSEDAIKSFSIAGKRLDVALYSKSVADKNDIYQDRALSAFVWDALLLHIPEGSTIYFAPDGILHLMAIEYLPTVNNGRYEMRRLTTTGLLAEPRTKHGKQAVATSLVIGGFDYDRSAAADDDAPSPNHDAYDYLAANNHGMIFSYLPGSKMECDSIKTLLADADVVNDYDESALKKHIGRYRNIHLSTHGYSLNVDVPAIPYAFRDSITEDKSLLACGIALSGANVLHRDKSREDGLLSARELCEMDLTGVDLVVASCCQSAQGRVSDEGPLGIVRGLKKAGVNSIIASLWPVDDHATMLLMQYFYDFWREGQGRDGRGCTKTNALRMAQEQLKQSRCNQRRVRTFNPARKTGEYVTTTSDYSAPYYWAPFIIIDDL